MLIFGKSVSDWQEKADYAVDKADNEFAELHEIRCEGIDDVHTAFAAMAAFAAETNCKNFLYHATINLNPGERLTHAQWMKAVNTLESNLKLTGHHRVVFEHIKKDRQHYHIVWSRFPPGGNGSAVNMAYDYKVHQRTAVALEQEFGLKPAPRRDQTKPSKKRYEINDRNSRIRVDPAIVTKEVTKIFRDSKTTKDFIANLAKAGYTLTRGKNNSYVIVDKKGGYHGLMRRIEGAKLNDLRCKFPDLDKMQLLSLSVVLKVRRPASRQNFKRAARALLNRPGFSLPRLNGRTPIIYRPRTGNFTALIAHALRNHPKPEKKYYPRPFMRRRKRKIDGLNEPVKLDPYRSDREQAELIHWAFENGRLDILAANGIILPPETFEP